MALQIDQSSVLDLDYISVCLRSLKIENHHCCQQLSNIVAWVLYNQLKRRLPSSSPLSAAIISKQYVPYVSKSSTGRRTNNCLEQESILTVNQLRLLLGSHQQPLSHENFKDMEMESCESFLLNCDYIGVL